MTEQIKFIVKEINASLGRNYDLIKFDSLDDKQLLQLLVDLLVAFNAGEKVFGLLIVLLLQVHNRPILIAVK